MVRAKPPRRKESGLFKTFASLRLCASHAASGFLNTPGALRAPTACQFSRLDKRNDPSILKI